MSERPVPPAWRLPRGVNSSLWTYAHSARIAEDEDRYFVGHPLFEADRKALDARFVTPGRLIDLGCGVGRHSIRFAGRGFQVTAVELSEKMLRVVGAKADALGVEILRVRANLCDLGAIPDATYDQALSMFSTLGMIRGRAERRQALKEAFRVLKPGGTLALHAHNLWLNLNDSQGRAWLFRELRRALRGGSNLGDRTMLYRGIPGMQVHLYRWPELKSELNDAGFRIVETLPIDAVTAEIIPRPWFLPGLRAGGWILFARRPD